jgi:signal transduction histidine kinase
VTRRVVGGYLVLAAVLLLILEVPLAILYARHERDALVAVAQRDASTLAALSEESIEHPGAHDLQALADRYETGTDSGAVVVDTEGNVLTATDDDGGYDDVLTAARRGQPTSGVRGGEAFAAVPVGGSLLHGAVLVSHSTDATDRRIHQLWTALLVIAAGVLGVAALAGMRLAKWIVEPLRALDDHAGALGAGDLDRRADPVGGPIEVRTLAATFNQMAERLEELVTSQRRFVADASHQLRSPLTALRLRLENVELGGGEEQPDLEAALAEVERLSRLVDGLLALARTEGARPQREPVDVDHVVRRRHEAWSALAEERAVNLECEFDGASPAIALAVPDALDQILDNLIDNALDVAPAGSVVQVRRDTVGDRVTVHVIDDGPGMTDAELRHAFDRFWRGGGRGDGSGLGLAIVDQLARLSGGVASLAPSATGGVDAAVAFHRVDGDSR